MLGQGRDKPALLVVPQADLLLVGRIGLLDSDPPALEDLDNAYAEGTMRGSLKIASYIRPRRDRRC